MIEQALFAVLATVVLGAALGVVTARSVFAGALWLVLCFLGVAGLYVLLQAPFLAVVQILIYVGAVSVLILFAVMLTRDMMTDHRVANAQWAFGAVLSLALFGALAMIAHQGEWTVNEAAVVPPSGGVVADAGFDQARLPDAEASSGAASGEAPAVPPDDPIVTGTTATLGRSFMTDYLLAFEVAGALLLVALVGAIVIARD